MLFSTLPAVRMDVIYLYFQLQHIARSQFPQRPLLQADTVEELLAQGDLCKPLPVLYRAFLSVDSPKNEHLWNLWNGDILSLYRVD